MADVLVAGLVLGIVALVLYGIRLTRAANEDKRRLLAFLGGSSVVISVTGKGVPIDNEGVIVQVRTQDVVLDRTDGDRQAIALSAIRQIRVGERVLGSW
jgi:hypothetical protein